MLMLYGQRINMEILNIQWYLEVGPNNHRFKVGDHAGVGTILKGKVYTFNGVDVDGTITKGGYSSYIVVHERQNTYCYKIPDNYPLSSAAPLLCAGIIVYSPMIRHKMNQPGKSLGVYWTRWS
ncbi:hypothetical protein C5167_032479, partial [Papaver somniferum]